MKLDLPEPFAPIKTLMGAKGSLSMTLMLLNPLMVMKSSASVGIREGMLTAK